MTIQVNSDTVLVKLRGTVTGVTRKSVELRDERLGDTRETERNLTVTKHDEAECEKAQGFLNQLRAAVDKYTVNVENLSLSNRAKIEALKLEVAPVLEDIERHNAGAQHHRVDATLLMLPIEIQTDPAAVHAVLTQIVSELDRAKELAKFGDVHGLNNWLKRSKNLGALVPAVTAAVVDDAIEEVRAIKSMLADEIRTAMKAGDSEETARGQAGALAKFVAIDTAIGMVAPTDIERATNAQSASDDLQ